MCVLQKRDSGFLTNICLVEIGWKIVILFISENIRLYFLSKLMAPDICCVQCLSQYFCIHPFTVLIHFTNLLSCHCTANTSTIIVLAIHVSSLSLEKHCTQLLQKMLESKFFQSIASRCLVSALSWTQHIL